MKISEVRGGLNSLMVTSLSESELLLERSLIDLRYEILKMDVRGCLEETFSQDRG